ncbi:PHP domain-containing protein [Cellulomonas sp. WB94]|uniref:PHP domain-containing protein n=1 Tax=Cellulomonas sp. WB94 TaxID=2173174 RepID=UPI001F5B7492|nr:PHP domain-containing protein [Cellulomonas sp. WB94]
MLHRVAFLLERAQADEHRSAAFRGAARVVDDLPTDELVARVAAQTLTDLPGIGARTAEVVTAAVRDERVEYLDRLEREAEPAPEVGSSLRRQLRGDLHSHTDASDGRTPLRDMVLAAAELGHEYLAITDHSPRLTVANGLSPARLRTQLSQIAGLRAGGGPFRVLSGIEVDILDDGSLDQDVELLDELDVVVASVHSKLRMDRPAMTRRLVAAVSDPRVDVLGHCTGRQITGKLRPPSEFDAVAVFEACAEHGTAVEINSRPDRLDPPHALLELAVAAGCVFSIDSDAHAPGQLDWQVAGCARAAEHGLQADRVVDTWPVEQLLDWTRTGST